MHFYIYSDALLTSRFDIVFTLTVKTSVDGCRVNCAAVNACGREFCASVCLLRSRDEYTCACPAGKMLHVDRHRCTGRICISSLSF